MIIVTGATGALNGATVDHLLERVEPATIGVSVRDPERARHLADRGIRVRRGSYDDPAALRHSFADAEQVLLVSSSDLDADVVNQHRTAIEAATEAGANGSCTQAPTGPDSTVPTLRLRSTRQLRSTSQHPASHGSPCATASMVISANYSAPGRRPARSPSRPMVLSRGSIGATPRRRPRRSSPVIRRSTAPSI